MMMLDEKVREAVLSIIDKEKSRSATDWTVVEAEAGAALAYINENGVAVDNAIYHFLEDADARRKSEAYARHQTENVVEALNG